VIIIQAMLREVDGTVAYRIERFLSETPITPAELQVSEVVQRTTIACVTELCGPPGDAVEARSGVPAAAAPANRAGEAPLDDAAQQLAAVARLVERYDPSDARRREPLVARLERVLAFHLVDDGEDTE